MREKAINGSGKSTLLDSNSSTSEFIKAVKQTMGDKQ
jgi:ABC-type cobalamin/Fe3+-siderophores transport system ATPase subunit